MAGDTKPNELLQRLLHIKEFKESVYKIRTEFEIPKDGFDTVNDCRNWSLRIKTGFQNYFADDSETAAAYINFTERLAALLQKYKQPATLISRLEQYVLHNDRFELASREHFACAIENPKHNDKQTLSVEQYWDCNKVRYTRLLIHEYATKQDVKDFVQANWSEIQHSIRPGRRNAKRIKKRTSAYEHALVYDIYLRIQDGKIKREKGHIEVQIQRQLRKEYEVELDSDNIRKIIATERKRRK